jgi:hypothetical protein
VRSSVIFISVLFILLFLSLGTGPTDASEIHPTSIKVLTLDDRPPNNLMLKQLCAIAGIYPEITFGYELSAQEVDLTDYDIVSLNAAVAVSLVGSRSADPSALMPPVVNPDALVHFAVPRAQPTVTDKDVLKEYQRILSQLSELETQKFVTSIIEGKLETTGDVYLDEYAYRLVGWLQFLERANLDPDRLLITLDDNRPGPLADRLKLELGKYSHHVMDGTDEGMMLLLARYLREHQKNTPSTVGVIWTCPTSAVETAPLESGYVVENLLSELDWLKARATSHLDMLESWRPILWINGTGLPDAGRENLIPKRQLKIGAMPVVVADIALTNGADPVMMELWRKIGPPPGLVGYLGWNTASNTLGSAVALWAAIDYAYATRPDPQVVRAAVESFLWSRLIDDWLYQRVVRADVSGKYSESGANAWDLTDEETQKATLYITDKLMAYWRENGIDMSIPLQIVEPLGDTGFVVELPWNRFFEINLYPTDRRGWVLQVAPAAR